MWCVITGQGGVSYDCSTDVYAILEGDLTGIHYEDEINEAFVTLILVLWTRTLWLWTETPFHAGLVLSMSTLSAKEIGCMDWPDPSPHVFPTDNVWDLLQKHTSSRPAQPHMRDDLANALY